jgi:hypothetical protein
MKAVREGVDLREKQIKQCVRSNLDVKEDLVAQGNEIRKFIELNEEKTQKHLSDVFLKLKGMREDLEDFRG